MRFRYSSVSAWIAASFVFPIHTILIFTSTLSFTSPPRPSPPTRRTQLSRRQNIFRAPHALPHEPGAIALPERAPASDETAPRLPEPAPRPPRRNLATSMAELGSSPQRS